MTYCERVKRKTKSDGSKIINEYNREISAFIESLYSDVEKGVDTSCCVDVAIRLTFRDFIQGHFVLSNRSSF